MKINSSKVGTIAESKRKKMGETNESVRGTKSKSGLCLTRLKRISLIFARETVKRVNLVSGVTISLVSNSYT